MRRPTGGCPQWRYEAAVYVLGASTPGDRRRYEAHLGSCPACRGEVAALAGLPGLLRRLSAAEAEEAGDQP
jgi:anti-sigma factor RsiW